MERRWINGGKGCYWFRAKATIAAFPGVVRINEEWIVWPMNVVYVEFADIPDEAQTRFPTREAAMVACLLMYG